MKKKSSFEAIAESHGNDCFKDRLKNIDNYLSTGYSCNQEKMEICFLFVPDGYELKWVGKK